MANEPEILCPLCGAKATVIVRYPGNPGESFGSANCLRCGGLDFKARAGKVIDIRPADADSMADSWDDEPDPAEYEEYLLNIGVRI